jgi:ATP-dependent DNA helicase RecG
MINKVGLDRIFKKSIADGKGSPSFDGTDEEYVVLCIPAAIKDLSFVYYLEKLSKEKQIQFNHVKDFIELEKIRESGKSSDKERIQFFLKNNLIEKTGATRGTYYVLAREFYQFINHKGEYTRKKWLNKDEQKIILLNYLKQYKKGRMRDFRELFKEKPLKNQQMNRLLKELSKEGVYFEGKRRSRGGYWTINGKGNDIER